MSRVYTVKASGTSFSAQGPTPRRAFHYFYRQVIAAYLRGEISWVTAETYLPLRLFYRFVWPEAAKRQRGASS